MITIKNLCKAFDMVRVNSTQPNIDDVHILIALADNEGDFEVFEITGLSEAIATDGTRVIMLSHTPSQKSHDKMMEKGGAPDMKHLDVI
jgi:hypothetical protein